MRGIWVYTSKELAELLARAEKVLEAVQACTVPAGALQGPRAPLHQARQAPEALATMKRELELFPEDPFMRNLVR
ncbi:MAG: hypothetical protein DMG09_14850 [Acidobacteria bacterium]|nr:MAG: hypothetical protein DMG09_14850 [Acidobacteriota bacterium]